MKRVLSILLLSVFLFNVGGYYILFWGLKFQTDQQMISRLDANRYEVESSIELKIPVTLPYPPQSSDFQRIDGTFEHNGEFFRLVKQKLENDTLYVVCIRDHATRKLVSTMTDYIRLTHAAPTTTDTGQNALNYLGKFIKDLYAQAIIALTCPPARSVDVVFAERPDLLLQFVVPVPAPPPKA